MATKFHTWYSGTGIPFREIRRQQWHGIFSVMITVRVGRETRRKGTRRKDNCKCMHVRRDVLEFRQKKALFSDLKSSHSTVLGKDFATEDRVLMILLH
jgi:hypothetical protein